MVIFAEAQTSLPSASLDLVRLSNGISLHYAHQGPASGPALVLLHGFTDSWFSFSRIMPLLPQHWRLRFEVLIHACVAVFGALMAHSSWMWTRLKWGEAKPMLGVPEGLDYLPLLPETNLLYCAAGHPLFQREDAAITRDDLQRSGLLSRGYLEAFDADFFDAEAHRATVHHIEAALLLIATGRFVGFLPEHVAAPEVAAGRLRALKPKEIRLVVPFSMITKRSRTNDPRVRRFRALIEQDLGLRRVG